MFQTILNKIGIRQPRPQYYAEHNTDRVIRETFFSNFATQGVMVEVGGGTPEFLSMSKHFKESGWRTIIIEPNPVFAEQHRLIGNEVYEFACSCEDRSKVPFTVVSQKVEAYGGIVTDHAFSSIEIKPSYAELMPSAACTKQITVEVRRLDRILLELGISKVDLLSVDVEGWEIEVMQGLNVQRVECPVVVLENFGHDPSYTSYMQKIGYKLKLKIEHNYVFTAT